MSMIDLKGLDNTSRIPKLVYTRNSSKIEDEDEEGSKAKSYLSPTFSQMENL